MTTKLQKLYCYVDETGQDAGSDFFIVTAVIAWNDIAELRARLEAIEHELKIGRKKWHKLRHSSRMEFINRFLQERFGNLHLYYDSFKKPLPAFFPTIETVRKSLDHYPQTTQALVSIDGLDSVSAKKMTNALRTKHRRLRLIKGPRDEGEVLLRLADRWVGCLRLALVEKNSQCMQIVEQANKNGLLTKV